MNHLVAIVGPTGIGKSRLALRLAQSFNGEIVTADSRQIYRLMDIATAKPTATELALVPHHLIDLINPDESFSLAQYQELACKTIGEIHRRNGLPFLVGGTGQYAWAVLEGWEVPHVPPDLKLRQELERKATESGADELYRQLLEVDPAAAQKIDKRNIRRVIRALEVSMQAQAPFSRLKRKKSPSFATLIIGLTAGRTELYRRIDSRGEEMVRRGLVAEVKRLTDMGYDFTLPSMSGIGYKQIGMFLKGELTLEEAIEKIKVETHRVARHQYAWFRLSDKRIHWFDVEKNTDSEIESLVSRFVADY